MPAIIEYFLKVSVSLAVVFLLYQLVFKRLTFYNWNRFYLLIYSALAFVAPLINIGPALQQTGFSQNVFVQSIPLFSQSEVLPTVLEIQAASSASWTVWDTVLAVMASGIAVLFLRFGVQLISLLKMMKRSVKTVWGNECIYQVEKDINPFSFGASIILNPRMHSPAELDDIIQHELVHVRQLHTIDIIWAELLCIFCWYNPFVWLLKNSIKQNLEFIADEQVLATGVDKKSYQYLLLKVRGNSFSTLSMPFNFSSLKKRIAMMNLAKHTKMHLLKFLFIIPLAAIVLLAFRTQDKLKAQDVCIITGIVFDEVTLLPIVGASIVDSATGIFAKSDEKGFYKLSVPRTIGKELLVRFIILKEGYPKKVAGQIWQRDSDIESSAVVLLGVTTVSDIATGVGLGTGIYGGGINKAADLNKTDYSYAYDKMIDLKKGKEIDKKYKNDSRPVHIIDGTLYVFSRWGRTWFNKDEAVDTSIVKVWVDGKVMTVEEANKTVNRFEYEGMAAKGRAEAKAWSGIDATMLFLYRDSIPSFRKQ